MLPHNPNAQDGAWQYCANTECDVIYYLDADIVDTDNVITQVCDKATDKPTPACFCFAHTPDEIQADFIEHDGVSTIKAEVKAAVADGLCSCEHLNLSGKCCLADIHRTIKSIAQTATV
ncbi:MAG: hypothetical protein DRJ50_12555 [Actinobacteria bacterium]|nr:MAG: hypothetical protein DRJ50_12555 [Actinomycetota bacterium]